jgi:enolase-phosphatase E1
VSSHLKEPITTVLLDIEGTTTPIDFVYKVLFPYARAHVSDYLAAHLTSQEAQADVVSLLEENAEDTRHGLEPPRLIEPAERVTVDALTAYIHWLMDRDRKTTALKSIQGKIWNDGYQRGDLRGEVFEDVPRAFKRWREQGRELCIYSSGSVLAQKLLFSHTKEGDLTPFISDYFDTNVGAKRDPESYRQIAARLDRSPSEFVFVSDVMAELDAARAAEFEVVLCVRPGNDPQQAAFTGKVIHSFDEISA